VVPFLWQRELAVRPERTDGSTACEHQRRPYRRGRPPVPVGPRRAEAEGPFGAHRPRSLGRGSRREVRQHPVEDMAGTSFGDRLLWWHLLELAPEREAHLRPELLDEPGADARCVPDDGWVQAPQRLELPKSVRVLSLTGRLPTHHAAGVVLRVAHQEPLPVE